MCEHRMISYSCISAGIEYAYVYAVCSVHTTQYILVSYKYLVLVLRVRQIVNTLGRRTWYICSVNCIQPPTPFQLQELWILSCVKMCRLPTHVFLSYITYTS